MSNQYKPKKVVKYHRPIRINVGVIAFFIIFIYIIVISVIYFNKERISVYEVIEKNISDDNTCTGVIIRNEKLVNSKKAGYLNYYAGDGVRVGKHTPIYTIDETGELYDTLSNVDSEQALSNEDMTAIRNHITSLKKTYTNSNFGAVEDFKYNIDNTILELSNSIMSENLTTILEQNGVKNSFQIVKANMSGTISYSMDGFENLSQNDVTLDTFDMASYERTQLRTNAAVEAGAPVYKMITSEDWSIVLSLTEKQYEKLQAKEQEQYTNGSSVAKVNITFEKDNLSTSVKFSTFQKGEGYFATLLLDKYMLRYINDRFVEVELSINAAEGLKIPVSSILEKDFYSIPSSYFTEGGDSGKTGLVKEVYADNGEVSFEFVATEVYAKDEEYGYVNENLFSSGDWIRNEATQERYQIAATERLEGVYNVNLGYCIFKQIEKVYENEEYCIVKKNTPNGLAVFDHIIVDANTVSDQELINKYKGE